MAESLGRTINVLSDGAAVRELRHIIRKIRPNLVSTHSSKAGVVGRVASKWENVPVIFTAHGWAFSDGVPSRRALVYATVERFLAKASARIITVSDYDRDLALRYRVASRDKLVTIHNGMPLIQRESTIERPTGKGVHMVMVARFQEQKDHALLVNALSRLTRLDWHLSLIGDGPLKTEVAGMVRRLGLQERVSFLGYREDVADILSVADMFVLTSNWEGFPRSILEAMRAGLPVVASDVGGCREAIADGVTGYLIPRGDGKALESRIELLIARPNLRTDMGRRGKEEFHRRFTFDRLAIATMRVYREVLVQSDPS